MWRIICAGSGSATGGACAVAELAASRHATATSAARGAMRRSESRMRTRRLPLRRPVRVDDTPDARAGRLAHRGIRDILAHEFLLHLEHLDEARGLSGRRPLHEGEIGSAHVW